MEEKTTIRTLIVEDEEDSAVVLEKHLENHFPMISLVETARCVKDAIKFIDKYTPELVFLDIELPDGNGFEILEKTTFREYDFIIVTGIDKYASKSWVNSAVHFILKPPSISDLNIAINRFCAFRGQISLKTKIEELRSLLDEKARKIVIYGESENWIIECASILYVESNGHNTKIHLHDGRVLNSINSIRQYESIFNSLYFQRTHRKYIVNVDRIKSFSGLINLTLVMKNDGKIPVSRKYRKILLAVIKKLMN